MVEGTFFGVLSSMFFVLGLFCNCSPSLKPKGKVIHLAEAEFLEQWFSNWGLVTPQLVGLGLCPLKGLEGGEWSDMISWISPLWRGARTCYIYLIEQQLPEMRETLHELPQGFPKCGDDQNNDPDPLPVVDCSPARNYSALKFPGSLTTTDFWPNCKWKWEHWIGGQYGNERTGIAILWLELFKLQAGLWITLMSIL